MKLDEQLKLLRSLCSEMGWGPMMHHIGCLMAEQADKTSGDQSGNLFECSRTLHSLSPFFEKCGTFTYPPDMVLPDGARVISPRDPIAVFDAANGFRLGMQDAHRKHDLMTSIVAEAVYRALMWGAGNDAPIPGEEDAQVKFMKMLNGALREGRKMREHIQAKDAAGNN